ncbi:Ribose-phosphate pyrophosphokinase [uncultured archaeon]|nr:Ribose-phosphate pyrophosphokinase [uncultured archaeon]
MDGVVLLADPKSKSWEFSNKIRDYIQNEKGEDVLLKELSLSYFRNKEEDLYTPENIRRKEIFYIQDSTKAPQNWWVELMLVKDLLLSASAESVSFVLPDMFYSRKDRKDKSRVPISARTVARTISPNLKRIITMDLHAPQIQGFYPENMPLDNLYSFPIAVSHLRKKYFSDLENLVVVSPDTGGVDRVRAFTKRLRKANFGDSEKHNYTQALISKERLEAGEVNSMELVGDVKGKNVLIVDDILDSGKTLLKAADLLKENGAEKLFCYAAHGLFTEGTENIKQKFDVIMTSNTHYRREDELQGVEILDVTSLFAEAIYRAQNGLSISSLFD